MPSACTFLSRTDGGTLYPHGVIGIKRYSWCTKSFMLLVCKEAIITQ